MPRLLASATGAAAMVLVVGLTGCSSSVLLGVPRETPQPTATTSVTAVPEPTATAAPDVGCDHLRITEPGNYVVGACTTITLEGTGIDVRVDEVGELVIRGDRLDVAAETIRRLSIDGQGNDIEAAEIGRVDIRGERNQVLAEATIEAVTVDGNENEVSSDAGIETIIDNGLLNEIG